MPIEQEPIIIEIPVDEEEVVLVPERRSVQLSERLNDGLRRATESTKSAWKSEKRKQAQAEIESGVHRGLRLSQVGLVRGLDWLSQRLASFANRFTPLEEPRNS